jgi:prepilin-type N-terminal cleavage/methylation domain-containing protein
MKPHFVSNHQQSTRTSPKTIRRTGDTGRLGMDGHRPATEHSGIPRNRSRSGFTVIEITLVIVIVGLLAALAIPGFQKVRDHANISRFMNDLRVISTQFESYHFAHARWPGGTQPGELPPEMEGYVSEGSFRQPNAVGGQWTWYNNELTGIAVNYGGTDREHILYQRIAEQIDNGDLLSGQFRLVGKSMVVWILEN